MPIAHISLPVRDLQASKAFYLAALAPLGYGVFKEFESVIGMGPKNAAPDLWLHKCPEEKAGTEAAVAKTHVAFSASRKADVHKFYAAAL
jgi:catechol 2,3-dioxygenase-like lactoylglutathione lyase family enzyme